MARRADRTLRPPTVFMRARKPCVRARRIFEGWKVRFMSKPAGKDAVDAVARMGFPCRNRDVAEKPLIRAFCEAPCQ